MKRHRIEYTDEAEDGLVEIFLGIWEITGSQKIADKYEKGIRETCESLGIFPFRFVSRDDLAPGVRMTHYRKNIRIAYRVNEETSGIEILRIESVRKNLTAEVFSL